MYQLYQQAMIWIFELLHGNQDPVFREQVYVPLGTTIVCVTIIVTLVFYYGLNGRRAKLNRSWPHWWLTLLSNVFLCFIGAWIVVWSTGSLTSLIAPTFILSLISILFSVCGFYLASLILKWFSPNASRTPH